MKHRFGVLLAAACVICLQAGVAEAALHVSAQARVPGQVLVKLKNPAEGLRLQGIQAHAISLLQQTAGDEAVVDFTPFQTDQTLYKVRLSSDSDVAAAIKALKNDPSVALVEPNIVLHAYETESGMPNDPDFAKLWGLKNTGQTDAAGHVGTAGSDIQVAQLWQQGLTGSRDVLVSIIDTGIDWTHPDLVANLYTNPDEVAGNGKDDDGNGFVDDIHGWNFAAGTNNSNDDNGHGTHVAGTIGASGNNGIGVVGVNWRVSLLPVKFLDANGSGDLQGAVEALNYAAKMKPRVINASWGGSQFSQILMDAVKTTTDAGILFVAAAGNDGADNDSTGSYPAGFNLPNILAVAATDNSDGIASFSNFGRKTVHVAAPGVKIYSTVKGSQYATYSGTSMASPHAAGVAALLLSVNPNWDYAQLKERMIKTCDPIPGLARKVASHGRISAYNAMNNIMPPSSEPDESLWKDVSYTVESEHPYKASINQTFTVSHPGAKFIRIHFEKIDVERNFDYVIVETTKGESLEKMTDVKADYMTDYVAGDSLVIRLKSDMSQQGWGFRVDRIQVIE